MSAALDWVTIREARPINTVGGQIIVPAFSYPTVFREASEIVVQYGYSTSRNFVVPRSPRKPTGANYVLAIRYRQGTRVTRFAFWTDENAVMPNIPLYDGEILPRNIVIEIWNINGQTEVSNVDETVVGLSLRRIVTDFSVVPAPFTDSQATTLIPQGVSFTPSNPLPLTGMLFRYDGDAVGGVLVGDPIISMEDYSANVYNLLQPVAAARPRLVYSGLGTGNQFLAAEFDGVDDIMPGPTLAQQDLTFYAVIRELDWIALNALFGFQSAGNRVIRQYPASPQLSFMGSLLANFMTTDKLAVDSYGILTVTLNGTAAANNTMAIGEFAAESAHISPVPTFEKLFVGGDNLGKFAHMQVVEIIGYAAIHTAAEQLAVRQYLSGRYWGGANLPIIFTDGGEWLDNPGFPPGAPNALPPPATPPPNVTPPDVNIGDVFGDPSTGDVFGDPSTGSGFGQPT